MSEPLVPLSFWQRISRTYLTGILGVLPLALTLIVLAWLVVFLHNLVGPSSSFGKLLRSAGMTVSACEATAYVIGLVGVPVERGPGRNLRTIMDSALDRVPVVNTVYDASKNLPRHVRPRRPSPWHLRSQLMVFPPETDPFRMRESRAVTLTPILYQSQCEDLASLLPARGKK
jgi:uncharacterized membrane protein